MRPQERQRQLGVFENFGGADGVRTRDLLRDSCQLAIYDRELRIAIALTFTR